MSQTPTPERRASGGTQFPPSGGRPIVPRTCLDWLDAIADVPESDLPCNVSTVAYAVKIAVLLRQANEVWAALFDELLASVRDEQRTENLTDGRLFRG